MKIENNNNELSKLISLNKESAKDINLLKADFNSCNNKFNEFNQTIIKYENKITEKY